MSSPRPARSAKTAKAATLLVAALVVFGAAHARDGRAGGSHAEAEARFEAKDFPGARALLEREVRRGHATAATHDLLARTLERLGENDSAAWRYDLAATLHAAEQRDGAARAAIAGLRRVEPISARREAFEKNLVNDLASGAEDLVETGHGARAAEVLDRIAPLARGKDAQRVHELLEKARASSREVDLESETRTKPADGVWPLFEHESRRYRFACHLEPELVHRLGDVMDDVFLHYVEVYFAGDAKKARAEKATIRIFPDKERMLALWAGGGGDGPEGWWSPGANEVITYDVRSRAAQLDGMLETLFHEASHQFTTLSSGGGYVPAWFNEGTASFFEGTRVMADRRVLWPDAALGRLTTLVSQLRGGGSPTALDVVSYSSPASYPAEYYSFGWGLVYFLQEYEDERTLAHVYRPLYQRYSTEIVKRAGDSLALFGEVFLGRESPLGHTTFAEFERDWSKWITGHVWPLFGTGREARARRLERAERYVAAADAARGDRKTLVSEDELLARALGHVEYVRTVIDGADAPDGALVLKQAALLARLDRTAAEAPLIELALDLADDGRFQLEPARYTELEQRLAKLDRSNAALRAVRSRTAGFVRSARALVADYRAAGDAHVLRACSFAAAAAGALGRDPELVASAKALRARARELGRLTGEVARIAAPAERWTTIFNTPARAFSASPERVVLDNTRAMARIAPTIAFGGEHELRATIVRESKPDFGSAAGVVVAARMEGDWLAVGIDERGQAGVWTVQRSGKDSVTTNRARTIALDPPVGETEEVALVIRVREDGAMEVSVGNRAPFEHQVPVAADLSRHAGIFTKNGRTALVDFVVETFP